MLYENTLCYTALFDYTMLQSTTLCYATLLHYSYLHYNTLSFCKDFERFMIRDIKKSSIACFSSLITCPMKFSFCYNIFSRILLPSFSNVFQSFRLVLPYGSCFTGIHCHWSYQSLNHLLL